MRHESLDALTVTGSCALGRAAQAACASRNLPLQAELGGNNAAIVWSDADLVAAAGSVAEGAFSFAGQRCTANRRVIVTREIHDRFLSMLAQATAGLNWGDPLNPETMVGPLISTSGKDRIQRLIRRAQADGAEVLVPHEHERTRAGLPADGAYVPPTIVLSRDPGQEIVQQESFGPILVVQTAADWEHAIRLCNGVPQGLVAALFSASADRREQFLERVPAGILKINRSTMDADAETPFGGWKASGIGPPEHGDANREFHARIQSIHGDECAELSRSTIH